jgi:hypothetical protein
VTALICFLFKELAAGSPDLIVLHGALDFGHCHLGLGVPTGGRWTGVTTLEVSHAAAIYDTSKMRQ